MLKKTIAGVLVCMMIAIPVLTGCSSVSNQNNEAVEATNENSVTSEIVSEAASEAESGTAGKTGGGKPWIDTYCNLILDWDARNERGVSDLLDLYDK